MKSSILYNMIVKFPSWRFSRATQIALYSLLCLLFVNDATWARIKLVTLPDRDATNVRLDNPQATLVEEERVLTLQQGNNSVDFSWKGVQIQADSIHLTLLEQSQPLTVISTSYPMNEQSLVWDLYSPVAQSAKVRISYLLSNIDRLVTYKAIVRQDESNLDLISFVVLRNFSGEHLPNSRFQLDYGDGFSSTVQTGETKQVQFFSANRLPIQKHFTFDAGQLPWDPKEVGDNVGIPTHYELVNALDKGLGKHALWDGKVRLYSEYASAKGASNGPIFLGEDTVPFTPIDEKVRLTIGSSRDIVVTQRKINEKRLNEKRNQNGDVVLYDMDETMQVTIENFKDQLAQVTLKEPMPQEWSMVENSHPYERKHNQEITFNIPVSAKQKVVVTYHYLQHNVRP